jgi:hypothetical protein
MSHHGHYRILQNIYTSKHTEFIISYLGTYLYVINRYRLGYTSISLNIIAAFFLIMSYFFFVVRAGPPKWIVLGKTLLLLLFMDLLVFKHLLLAYLTHVLIPRLFSAIVKVFFNNNKNPCNCRRIANSRPASTT